MPAKAQLRHLRIAPRKVRLVADLIRGKKAKQAKSLLEFSPQKSASILLKLLKSAIVSAKDVFQLEEKNLYISKITVDEGPKLKRWRPRSRGRAYEIQKKTSHVTLFLDGIEEGGKKTQKIKKKKASLAPVNPISSSGRLKLSGIM